MCKYQVIDVDLLDLQTTLDSGQVFRYETVNGWTYVCLVDRVLRLKQDGKRLFFDGCDRRFLTGFLRLETDFAAAQNVLRQDPVLARAIKRFPGLRLLRQDPWECLASFVCSAASNIPRIKKNIRELCRMYGPRISLGSYHTFGFPRPGRLGAEREMRNAGLGFRARYLAELNSAASDLDLESLRLLDYHDAKARLTSLPGVGEKIADCVLLFALDFMEAFPVDVWIRRVIQDSYLKGKKVTPKAIMDFARHRFGKYAGYAQQFLYHEARTRRARNG